MSLTKTHCDSPGTLYRLTLGLVKKDPDGLRSVHVRSGVPLYWLRKFAAGKIPKPNGNRLQHLYEKLSGKKVRL